MSVSSSGKLYVNDIEKAEAFRNRNVLEYALSTGVPLKRVGSFYQHKEHDSMVFFPTSGKFYWYSKNITGDAIDYITKVEGRNYLEALLILSNGVGAENHYKENIDIIKNLKYEKKEIPKEVFNIEERKMILPDKATNNIKVIDYLVNIRKIDRILVNYLIQKGKVYQSVEFPKLKLIGYDKLGDARYVYKDGHFTDDMFEKVDLRDTKNIESYSEVYKKSVLKKGVIDIALQSGSLFYVYNLVMVGYNEQNVPEYASRRSLNTTGKSYKTDVLGSKKSCPFVINKNKDSTHIVLCESPIEVISYYEIANKLNLKNKDAHIISAGGVSATSIDGYLKSHPNIKSISLAFNNDDDEIHKENAGLNGYKSIYDKYSDKLKITKETPYLNDWNDMLKDLKNKGIIKDVIHKEKIKTQDKEMAI